MDNDEIDFSVFVGSVVKINLISTNVYYYCGKCLSAGEKFLKVIDEKGRNIFVSIDDIKNIEEVRT